MWFGKRVDRIIGTIRAQRESESTAKTFRFETSLRGSGVSDTFVWNANTTSNFIKVPDTKKAKLRPPVPDKRDMSMISAANRRYTPHDNSADTEGSERDRPRSIRPCIWGILCRLYRRKDPAIAQIEDLKTLD